ncbi:acyl CoA:acetate/3-ketoacid CoA transferase [Pseudonocardia acidicola]|uniref:Acyl CoA:acetate/3-ketoacid CoA transferase n=1 Tax=Pseudonocardia acidicola TaxID=2724939 RepID=A0ABX1SC60_9PSEU|nr:CoA-transferase [Pseudonocardia acidicola]NMH98462.1 acyl CoA:acetate/3-ketoacid CoA transferase [Pseudonocardia acidicola]
MSAQTAAELVRSLPGLPERDKTVTADEAVRLIRDRDAVVIGGFLGACFPEELTLALEARFLETGRPRELTVVSPVAAGDLRGRGLDHLAREGLLRRAVGGHFAAAPAMQKLAVEGAIEAYNLPLGCLSQLFRDIAAHKPGTLSRVGLGTFVDPRHGGGKINQRTTEDLIDLVTLGGEEYLLYKSFGLDVALLRGTTADPDGNVTMEHEALTVDSLAIATAVHNARGLVIVQVEQAAERRSLHPRAVEIPGPMVDCVVVASPEHHWQTMGARHTPAYSGELRAPLQSVPPLPLTERKVIVRRAAMELRPNSVVNLGVGIPEGISSVAHEERILDSLTLTAEPGVIGGFPAGGLDFGAALNPRAVIEQAAQFDFYDGGGLDAAFLGLAQVDREGNVDVSRFGPRLAGAGGFINISQNARRLVFLGTFVAFSRPAVEDGRLVISDEHPCPKFVTEVEQRTFSGPHAAAADQPVLYVTERCVFRLTPGGLELIEIAPGVDLERDVLDRMGFAPIVRQPGLMDARIFRPEIMGLRDDLLAIPMAARFSYDEVENLFFLNLEGLSITSTSQLEAVRAAVDDRLAAIGHRVYAIVNYDNVYIAPHLTDQYTEAVRSTAERHYLGATRYTTSAFMRLKLGTALDARDVAPHIHESRQEATAWLRRSRTS